MGSSFLRKTRHVIEAFLFLIFYSFFWIFPLSWASWLGGTLARLIGPSTSLNKRALRNLKRAFPEKTESECFKISQDMWENLGQTMGEFPHMHTLVKGSKYIQVEGIENVDFLRDDKNAGLFFSAHLANWEISSLVAVQRNFSLLLLYRASNNPVINLLIQGQRQKCASLFYYPKGKLGARAALKALKEGGHVGMLMDQKMNDGMPSSFFGMPAWTAPAIAQFSLKFKAPIVAAHVIRLKGARFKIIYEKPFFAENTGNPEEDIKKVLEKINQTLERWVRENPGQWLWLHNRWR
ncbi:MAG TPA: lauroyl acyltransferase [Alphaproteobacteria bacterium]|nr:lauroyl acyltransferase [Alphaproteobacteria bacterium]HQS94109.1 lauroyl acyltransferase [Alphaproteobacteria bacterium]